MLRPYTLMSLLSLALAGSSCSHAIDSLSGGPDDPPAYAEGNPCETEGELQCLVQTEFDAAELGYTSGIPVMHCVNGSWTQVFSCDADHCGIGSMVYRMECGDTKLGVQGGICAHKGFVCNSERTMIMVCGQNGWEEYEPCDAPQRCRGQGDGSVICR